MTALVREFGAQVRRLRETRRWSQEQLAEHAALNRSYVGEIERGAAIASLVTVEKLAHALQVPIGDLLSGAIAGHGTPLALVDTLAGPLAGSTASP